VQQFIVLAENISFLHVDYLLQDLPMVQPFTRTICGSLLAMMVTKGIYLVKSENLQTGLKARKLYISLVGWMIFGPFV